MKLIITALAALFLTSTAHAADDKWWLLAGAEALLPIAVRTQAVTETDEGYTFRYRVQNTHSFDMKCDFEAAVDQSNGDDIATEYSTAANIILKAGQKRDMRAKIFKEDIPEGYHVQRGSLHVQGTCLGLAADAVIAEVPEAHSVCTESSGCLRTCQAADNDLTRCATEREDWGAGRFLLSLEGMSTGPTTAADLYAEADGTTLVHYIGPKSTARVCAGRVVTLYKKGAESTTVTVSLGRKLLRANRTSVYESHGGADLAAGAWTLDGGGSEIFCMPAVDGGDPTQLPDPEAAYRDGIDGATRFEATAAVFLMSHP